MYHFGEKDDRVKGTAFVLGGDVEMLACAATCGASDANGEADEDGLTLGDKDSGEVAITDADVAVADGDEVAGTSVVADLLDYAIACVLCYVIMTASTTLMSWQ